MALIPEIDRLLDCDEQNIRETRRFLSAFTQDLPEALNQAAVLFSTASRAFGQGLPDHFSEILTELGALGVSKISELEAKLQGTVPPGQEAAFANARDALDRYYDRESRGVLVARVGVLYATAAADLLRMRVAGPLGYVRVQCESLALMKLIRATPGIAREWRNILTEAEGKTFYRKYQPSVKKELKSFDLEFAYARAMAAASVDFPAFRGTER